MTDYPSDLDITPILGKPVDMSDSEWWLEHTKCETKRYCPVCEPDRDPVKEPMLEPSTCSFHDHAAVSGQDDRIATARRIQILDAGM